MEKQAHFRAGLPQDDLVHSLPRVIEAIINAIPDAPPEPPLWEGHAIFLGPEIYSISSREDDLSIPSCTHRKIKVREVRE